MARDDRNQPKTPLERSRTYANKAVEIFNEHSGNMTPGERAGMYAELAGAYASIAVVERLDALTAQITGLGQRLEAVNRRLSDGPVPVTAAPGSELGGVVADVRKAAVELAESAQMVSASSRR